MDSEGDKVRVTLRMEADVYAMLIDSISKSGRSLNSEINARIRDSFCNDSPLILTTTEKVFAQIIETALAKAGKG